MLGAPQLANLSRPLLPMVLAAMACVLAALPSSVSPNPAERAANGVPPADTAQTAGVSAAPRFDRPALQPVLVRDSSQVAPTIPNLLELGLYELVNSERGRAGLPALQLDPELLTVARTRAAAQDGRPLLSHYDPDGGVAMSRLLADSGLEFQLAGENLARVQGPAANAPERAEQALMSSPSHRANILDPTFDQIAVGSTLDSNGRIVFAQIFRKL